MMSENEKKWVRVIEDHRPPTAADLGLGFITRDAKVREITRSDPYGLLPPKEKRRVSPWLIGFLLGAIQGALFALLYTWLKS